MQVFSHHIYEYKKGVRRVILHTLKNKYREVVERKLQKDTIAYFIQDISNDKFNVFFGSDVCIDVVRDIVDKPLNLLTPEEDFIIGALLGYEIKEQARRFHEYKKKHEMRMRV